MGKAHHKPFHILQLVHSLEIGGTERVVCDLTKHFNGESFRTSVCCLDELGEFGKDLIQKGIPVRVFKRRPGIDYPLIWALRKLYREWGIDLVHSHQYTPYFYGAAACLGSSSPTTVFTEHGRHQPDRVRPRRVIFNQILKTVTSGYTAVSDFTRMSLALYEKIPAAKIQVIYNGLPRFAQDAYHERNVSRKGLGIRPDVKIVLSVGRIDRIKDFKTLIWAFERMIRKVPDAILLIAGGGDQSYLEELFRETERLKIGERIKFLGARRDIPDLISACDVFALTSISEAASMTILEAMAGKRSVVATMTGGNAELVVSGETGILVPVGDHKSVSEALTRLLMSPEESKRMGDAGRSRFEALFTFDTTVASYEKLYTEIMER